MFTIILFTGVFLVYVITQLIIITFWERVKDIEHDIEYLFGPWKVSTLYAKH